MQVGTVNAPGIAKEHTNGRSITRYDNPWFIPV